MAKKMEKAAARKPGKVGLLIIVAVIVIGAILIVKGGFGGNGNTGSTSDNSDLAISKNEITESVKFYPYSASGTEMEVMAVKAPDGSIRTALNTCQVCYGSGRGYYKQQGDEVICQNCGNRFKIDQIEKIKGGCNPVPILPEYKTDDGASIIISKVFLEEAKVLFTNWKK